MTNAKLDTGPLPYRSDAHILYDYILENRPTGMTTHQFITAVRRDDGSPMSYGSASASLGYLTRKGMLKVTERQKVGPEQFTGVYRYVYSFDKGIPVPRWTGGKTKGLKKPEGRTTHKPITYLHPDGRGAPKNAADNLRSMSTGVADNGGSKALSQRLLEMATEIESLEKGFDIKSVSDDALVAEMDRRYLERTMKYRGPEDRPAPARMKLS